MSIYEDLANSDFMDKGKFKAQLQAMGHDPDANQEEEQNDVSAIQDDYGENEQISGPG